MNIDDYLHKQLSLYKHLLPKNKTVIDAVLLFKVGQRESGWTFKTAKSFTDKFPEKISGKVHYHWFLQHQSVKWCTYCDNVFPKTAFNINNTNSDGLQSYCVDCTSIYMKKYPQRGNLQRAKELQAIPKWANLFEIAQFYNNCPEGFHVDHIIPLAGKHVCGLHVLNNLQYLPAKDNLIKSNKYEF